MIPDPNMMKNILFALALLVSGTAFAAPVNKTCPVGSRPARTDITVTHKGMEVGFCCNNCKKKFEADPAKFEDKIKE